MTKTLKPYTIIPSDLYVQRDADRQIKNIINDMGRPGYVLVSRQMGKTNLLLNAKRTLETQNDVFIYVDLSNPFDDAKSCFENIIDTAIETNEERFFSVGKIIRERRKEMVETPPHKQHTNELRMLLNFIPGKLIIILDEIDALTKTQYSDLIFAQIRSIYFSRVNYKELEKLTYILSGVIEPTEIIKDPKISPFNIGQKIFLNDFSREEFHQFIKKSNLILDAEITDRIYYWTNGNPRMTWDVCSEVENEALLANLTPSKIDKIVYDIYLITFDRPPIDNIRELVKKDKEIRNSIVEIEYNKGKEISDKIKNKLYLAGIINYNDSDVQIKNEIIKLSLNSDWIRSLEEEERGLIRMAIDNFISENYLDSLNLFEKYLQDNVFNEDVQSLYYYYMGYASYRNSEFSKSIQYFNRTNFDKLDEPKLYYTVLNIKGLIYYYQGEIDESLASLKKVVESDRKDETYIRALLNYGSISLKSDKVNYRNDAFKIFEDVISEKGFNKDRLKEGFITELKAIAHYNLGQLQQINGDIGNAIANYTQAMQLCKLNIRPTIILALLPLIENKDEQYVLLNDLIDLIINDQVKPIDNDPEQPIDFNINTLRETIIISFIQFKDTLFEKIKQKLSLFGRKSLAEHLYDLAVFSINENKNYEIAIKLLEGVNLINPDETISFEVKFKVVRLLSFLTRYRHTYHEYIILFSEKRPETIEYIDVEIFATYIYNLNKEKNYKDALFYSEIINNYKNTVSADILINFLVIYNIELNIYIAQKDKNKAVSKAEEIITLANDQKNKYKPSNLLGEKSIEVIVENAEATLRSYKSISPTRAIKKYGRNDLIKVRYKDGTIIETKYKKIEAALAGGECFILS